MKCAVDGCPGKSECDHCHRCQYHHDEELGQLREGDINPMGEPFCLQKTFDTTCPHGYDQDDVRKYIDTIKAEVSKEFDGSPASVIHKIIDKFANKQEGVKDGN